MEVDVDYLPDTYDEFIQPLENKKPGLTKKIIKDFKNYIESKGDYLPNYFGRDALYTKPNEVANIMHHIHLCIPPDKFPLNRPQYHRVCPKKPPEKDVALVYVVNSDQDHIYRILAILMPSAHSKANNNDLMCRLGSIARTFKRKIFDL